MTLSIWKSFLCLEYSGVVGELSIVIRRAVEGDKSAFVEMTLKLTEFNRENHDSKVKYDDFGAVLSAVAKQAEQEYERRKDDSFIVFAVKDNKPVGFASAQVYVSECTADNGTGKMGLFDKLYVDPSARGLGIGKELAEAIMGWFHDNGISRVKLHAYSWNTQARRLYEKLGFAEYLVSFERIL